MKRLLQLMLALAAIPSFAAEEEENPFAYVEYDYEHWYVDAGPAVVIPQGGGDMGRRAGAMARIGYYADDFLAVEASAAWMERGAGLGLRGLWHWWGYEKFDPFFTFGAEGWFGGGDAGPCAGWGAFWHFDDNWSFRFDASFMLGVADGATAAFSIAAGFQYSW